MTDLLMRLSHSLLDAADELLPRGSRAWAAAMRRELAEAPDGWAAIRFAAGCLRAALVVIMAAWLDAARELAHPAQWSRALTMLLGRPRLLGLACGAFAVTAGLAYLSLAGAPSRYLLVNLLTLALGTAMWVALGRKGSSRLPYSGLAVLALAFGLLATALFGTTLNGATRWVQLGPIGVQTSLAFVPFMVVLFVRRPEVIGTAGMVVAALALAMQGDRAMAGALAASLLVAASSTRNGFVASPSTVAVLAFGWTLCWPDAPPAAPFVDRVFATAFSVHPLAGVAVMAGTVVLLLPAFSRTRQNLAHSAILAFGACWLVVVVAAALSNYPTPLVGYGGSAVLGYLLSVALLPSDVQEEGSSLAPESEVALGESSGERLSRLGLVRSAAPC